MLHENVIQYIRNTWEYLTACFKIRVAFEVPRVLNNKNQSFNVFLVGRGRGSNRALSTKVAVRKLELH